jgi:hypothetical protein
MSLLAGELLGAQRPRLFNVPEFLSSSGEEAIEVGRLCGAVADPWQEFVLVNALGELGDGRWAAPTVGLVVARQNGKNFALMVRELAGAFAFGEKLIVHSAHEQKTAVEHFRRLLAAIENVPEFDARVLKVSRGKGSEAIELRGGQRILFNTRSGSAFRGFSEVDLLVIDEAMIFPETAAGAMIPTLSANSMRGTLQIWWTGSAVDELNPKHDGVAFSRIREQGLAGHERVAYFEWSAPFDDPDSIPPEAFADIENTKAANPGLGVRISPEWVDHERTVAMGARAFAVERWSVGCWPNPEGSHVISLEQWAKLMDTKGKTLDPLVFSFDVTPDRAFSTIAAAGRREDGLKQVEVVMHGPGTGWIVPQLTALHSKHHPAAVVCDGVGPAGSLIHELEQQGVPVTALSSKEHGQACGAFYDHVMQEQLRHLGTPELADALKGATRRSLGEAWAWDRKKSTVDISPLVACTLALWGHLTAETAEPWMGVW